jgi:hypothetical protein
MSLDITAALQGLVDAEGAAQYSAGQTTGQAAGAESRQAEVDQLRRDLEVSEADGTDLARRLAAAVRERDTARDDLAALQAQYDAHMATHAARTAFGACPTAGTATSSVLSKYGTKASVRIFVPGGLGRVTRPDGASRVHVSWKPALGSTITDAQVIDACTGLRDGDLVEVWHESDVKYRKGGDLAAMQALKAQLHQRVAALRAGGAIAKVLTVNTWAGWSVDSNSNINTAILHAPADLLGIDMDGIPANDDFYPYADQQMGAKLVSAFKAGGYTGWTVPEFCMPSVASDASRAKRIAWFQAEVARIRQGVSGQGVPAPLMIAWFDTAGIIGDSERLTAANEISAWSALVSTNA